MTTPLWRNSVFRTVVLADLFQHLAIWTRNIALLFYVMEMTGNDPVAVSLLTVMEYVPIFIFSFIGGTLADRWNPRTTVIVGDALSALSIGVILLCMMSGIWQAVFVATIVSAIVSQFSQPSSSILFKRHIPEDQVSQAISITQGMMSLFIIVGPMIGTAIYTSLGIDYSMIMLIVLFLSAAGIQLSLPRSKVSVEAARGTVLQEMREGLMYVKQQRNLLILALILLFISLGFGLIQPLDIFIVTERLGLAKESLQWFFAVSGSGLFLGSIIAAVLSKIAHLYAKRIIFFSITLLAISITVEVLSQSFLLTAAMRFIVGLTEAFLQLLVSALMIKWVDAQYVGRTSGILAPILVGGTLIGSGLSGVLVTTTSLMTTFFISSALVAIGGLCTLLLSLPKSSTAESNNLPDAWKKQAGPLLSKEME